MQIHQLHQVSDENFEVFASWSPEHGLRTKKAGRVPLIRWPDQHWCLEANLFMAELLGKGYSTKGEKGGTLGTKAAYLAPLIRHCFANGKQFHKLTDSAFVEIVLNLYETERHTRAGVVKANNNTSVRSIATTWLDFLHFVGEFRGDQGYVGPLGAIDATRETREIKKAGRASYKVSSWTHKAISVGDAEHRRLPMTEANIGKLRETASARTTDAFLRVRRLVMLELFDAVGMRRIEAAGLKAKAINAAILEAMASGGGIAGIGYLKFQTFKGGRVRNVPLSPATLSFFAKYLKLSKPVLRRLGRAINDDTPFFFNLDTGDALNPNTFTLEFWKLATEAQIHVPCSPHLVRHRYIVRAFVRLILAHQLECKDDFRKMMLDQEAFLYTVSQITGHSSPSSLDSYINLAFEEVGKLSKTMERVEMQAHYDALRRAGERYAADIAAGVEAGAAGDSLYAALAATMRLTTPPN